MTGIGGLCRAGVDACGDWCYRNTAWAAPSAICWWCYDVVSSAGHSDLCWWRWFWWLVVSTCLIRVAFRCPFHFVSSCVCCGILMLLIFIIQSCAICLFVCMMCCLVTWQCRSPTLSFLISDVLLRVISIYCPPTSTVCGMLSPSHITALTDFSCRYGVWTKMCLLAFSICINYPSLPSKSVPENVMWLTFAYQRTISNQNAVSVDTTVKPCLGQLLFNVVFLLCNTSHHNVILYLYWLGLVLWVSTAHECSIIAW